MQFHTLKTKFALLILGASLTTNSFAHFLSHKNWEYSGRNELRFQHYRVTGDKSRSGFNHLGGFYGNSFDLSLDRVEKNGRSTQIEFAAFSGDDEYLAVDGAFSLERALIKVQRGNTDLPYQLTIGDARAFFSKRTLLRGLKGASLELQPKNLPGGKHSFLAVMGAGDERWGRAFSSKDEIYYTGFSYLIKPSFIKRDSTFGIHTVYTRHANKSSLIATQTGSDFDQMIVSFVGEVRIHRNLKVEGELAHMHSDRDNFVDTNSFSGFTEITGKFKKIRYRTRYEQTGQHYTPAASSSLVTNQRKLEVFTFRPMFRFFKIPGTLNGRVQYYQNGYQGTGPRVDTQTYGLGYNGRPLRFRKSLNANFDWNYSDIGAVDGSTNRHFTNYALGLTDYFKNGYFGNYRVSFNLNDDRNNRLNDRAILSNTITGGRRFRAEMFNRLFDLNLSVGIFASNQWRRVNYNIIRPVFNVGITGKKHSLLAFYNYYHQRFGNETSTDTKNQTLGLTYTFTHKNHEGRVEFYRDAVGPKHQSHTGSEKISTSYVFKF